jgi:hypothetical protein
LALKKILSKKYFLIITVVLLGLGLGVASSAYVCTVVISSSGQIRPPFVYAAGGSASDIQTAINSLSPLGGTVYVPAGTFYWNGGQVTVPGGVDIIGANQTGCGGKMANYTINSASTILHNNAAPPNMPTMFVINGNNGKPCRISGIQFEATPPASSSESQLQSGSAISTTMLKNFRIDHCTFLDFVQAVFIDSSSGSVSSQIYSNGVLDHNYVDCPSKVNNLWQWGNGFYSRGNMKPGHNNWDANISDFAGVNSAANTTVMYVEDNRFVRISQSTDGVQGSWVVVRFNLFEKGVFPWGDVQVHGSQDYYGARGMEVYNNTFVGTTNYLGVGPQNLGGIRIRGGSGIFFNNTITYTANSIYQCAICLDNFDVDSSGNSYPITNINQTFIWSNTAINCTLVRATYGTQNVNYFLRAPSQIVDGFNYVPYAYPYPLTLNT